jgi:hypothetical protein
VDDGRTGGPGAGSDEPAPGHPSVVRTGAGAVSRAVGGAIDWAGGYASIRYPSPRTVTRTSGVLGTRSIFERIRLMCTSRVLVSPK